MGRLFGTISIQLIRRADSAQLDGVYVLAYYQQGISIEQTIVLPLDTFIEHQFQFDVDADLVGEPGGPEFLLSSLSGTALATVLILGRLEVNLFDYAAILLKRAFSQSSDVDYAEQGLFEVERLGIPARYNITAGVRGVFLGFAMLQTVTRWIEEDIKQAFGDRKKLEFFDAVGDQDDHEVWLLYKKFHRQRRGERTDDLEALQKGTIPYMSASDIEFLAARDTTKKSSQFFETETPQSSWLYQVFRNSMSNSYIDRPLFFDYELLPLLRDYKIIKSLTQQGTVSVWNHETENPKQLAIEMLFHPATMAYRVGKYLLDTVAKGYSSYTGLDVYDGQQGIPSVLINAVQTMTYVQSMRYGAHIGSALAGPYGLVAGAYLGGALNILMSSLASNVGKNVIYQYGTKPIAEYTGDVIENWSPNQLAIYLRDTQYHRKGLDFTAQMSANIMAQLLLGLTISRLPKMYRVGAAGQQMAYYDNGFRMGAGILDEGVQQVARLGQYVEDMNNYQENRLQMYDMANRAVAQGSEIYKDLKRSLFILKALGFENQDKAIIDAQGKVVQQNYDEFAKFYREQKSSITSSFVPRIEANLEYILKHHPGADKEELKSLIYTVNRLGVLNDRYDRYGDSPRFYEVIRSRYNDALIAYEQQIQKLKPKWKWHFDGKPQKPDKNVIQPFPLGQLPDFEFIPDWQQGDFNIAQNQIYRENYANFVQSVQDTLAKVGMKGLAISSGASAFLYNLIKNQNRIIKPKLSGNRTNRSRSLNTTKNSTSYQNQNNTIDPVLTQIEEILQQDTELKSLVQAINQTLQANNTNINQTLSINQTRQNKFMEKIVAKSEKFFNSLKKQASDTYQQIPSLQNTSLPSLQNASIPQLANMTQTQMLGAALLGATGTYGLYKALQDTPEEKIQAIQTLAQDQDAIERIQSDFDRGIVFNNTMGWQPSARQGRNLYRYIEIGRVVGKGIDKHLEDRKKVGHRRRLIYYQ